MKTSIICAVVVILLAGSSTILFAGNQDSSNFNVKITIKESCNISSQTASDLDFGTVERSSKVASSQGNLNVTCTQGTPYNIALKSNRTMTSSSTQMSIPYTLYQDSNQQLIWGNDASNAYNNIGTGSSQTIPVWGKISDQANVPAGRYSDTVTAIINY